MKGRKPKPAAVRALHGSRSRPHHRKEPTIPGAPHDDDAAPSVPRPPRALTRSERKHWNHFAPLLAGARILTPADVETLADYCRACVAVEDRSRRLRAVFRKRLQDTRMVSLLDSQIRGWVERKTKIAGELGLTAISRTRVAWSGHAQVKDPIQQPRSKLAQLQEQAAALRRPVGVK